MNILQEAESLVDGARQDSYGDPSRNIKDIANLWSVWLDRKVTPKDVCIMMALLKISREKEKPKRDTLVDTCGYMYIIEKLGSI